MVALDTVHQANAAFSKRESLTAVFVGGTTGIGEYSVRALTNSYGRRGRGLRVYIVGRNKDAAEAIISDLRGICSSGHFEFIQANSAALLKNVDRVSADIIKAEEAASQIPKIDLLVMTQGYMIFSRKDTAEGLDDLTSLLYYSRMRFITQLLPLLLQASPAHIVSVFSPKRDAALFEDDLSLRQPTNYSFMNMGSHVSYMTTFYFEEIAMRHPGKLSLVHYYPGIVLTKGFLDPKLSGPFKILYSVVSPIIRPFTMHRAESGARVIFNASDRFPAGPQGDHCNDGLEIAKSSNGVVGGGAYRVDWNGEILSKGAVYKKLEQKSMSQKVWDHTNEAFKVISAGDVFVG